MVTVWLTALPFPLTTLLTPDTLAVFVWRGPAAVPHVLHFGLHRVPHVGRLTMQRVPHVGRAFTTHVPPQRARGCSCTTGAAAAPRTMVRRRQRTKLRDCDVVPKRCLLC